MRHREPSVKLPLENEIGQPGRAEAYLAPGSQERAPDPHPEVGRREEALVAPGLAKDAGVAQECLFQLWQCLLSRVFGIKSYHYRTHWLRIYHLLESPVN